MTNWKKKKKNTPSFLIEKCFQGRSIIKPVDSRIVFHFSYFFLIFLGCIRAFVLQNIKISIFSALVLSGMIRLLKYNQPTLYRVLSQFHFERRDDHPALRPKNLVTHSLLYNLDPHFPNLNQN